MRPSPARDRILRYLLASCASERVSIPAPAGLPLPSLYKLADRAGVAFSWVHKTVGELADRGWVHTDGRIEVTDPTAVFAWWRENRTVPKVHGFHVANVRTTAAALFREHQIPHAITTYYAENAYQGHLFARRLDTYVRADDLERARAALLELGGQLGGTTFRLLTGDDAILDEVVLVGKGPTELRYAPVPQVILDLMTEGGSAREAADLLLQRAYPHAHPRLP